MNFNEYQKLAVATKKQWDNNQLELADCGLGLTGEAGEVAEVLKKHIMGSRELDLENIKKELGDVLWYAASLCDSLNISMQEVAELNIEKLRKRHGDSYSGFGNR
jgi:NTP pyrophosphatase (non-canonical NTP hydrolase)